MAPNSAHPPVACAAYGPGYPHADKRRGAPVDACGIVVAPMALVASLRPRIPAYQGAQVAAVGWVRRAPRRGLVGCYGCGKRYGEA